MAECTTSFDPPCTNAGGAKKREVEIEESLFEHPAVVGNVVAYLGLWEVLSLGSCSKYLNSVCESDYTWKLLYERRWGRQAAGQSSEDAQTLHVNKKGWKPAYIARQKEWFAKILEVLSGVERSIRDDCLHSHVFHNGIDQLIALDISYDDIYSFFFSKKLNVVFTMLGLYYAFFFFGIPGKDLKKAMAERGVIDKVVCARWTIPTSCSYGFYIAEENHIRVYSLGMVVDKEMSILCLMRHAKNYSHRDEISDMTISYKIPEPEKEHLENAHHVGESSTSSSLRG